MAASSASLSLSNMSSATIYQYRGSSSVSVDGWKIGYALSQANWNLCIKFTPSKTLTKVVFNLTADQITTADSKGFFYLLRTSSGHPGVDTIDGGTNFKFSSKKATLTLTRSGNFVAGTPYYLWLSATSGTYNSVAILYSSGISCTTTIASFTVTFNPNGGTTTKTSQTGTSVTLPITSQCTRTGYQLAGWATSSTATSASYSPGASYTPSATITLYAVWTANKLQLAYHSNGGSISGTDYSINSDGFITNGTTVYFQSRNYGGSTVNPYDAATFGLTRTGYTFDGNWYLYNTTDGITSTARHQYNDYEIADFYHYTDKTKNINNSASTICYLYAGWTPNTYQVTYNANGGTGAPGTQTKTHDISLTLSSTIPIRSGYTFQGWATSADGEVIYAPGATYTANSAITLYAVWKADVSPVYIKDSSGNFNAYYAYIANSNGEFELYSAYIYTNNEWKECIM